MTAIMEKALEVGRELRNSEQFKRLEQAEQRLQVDTDAQQLIEQTREAQEKLVAARRLRTEPDQEQVAEFEEKKNRMTTNITVTSLLKAQQEFDAVLASVNDAIIGVLRGDGPGNSEVL